MGRIQLPLKVFISYSHQDEESKIQLIEHLQSLIRQGYIELSYDDMILPGESVDQKILQAIHESHITLLLVSAAYLGSRYCYEIELKEIMALRDKGMVVIPVLLRPVDLEGTPFSGLMFLPEDRKAISTFSNKDEAFMSVALGIRRVVEDCYKKHIPGMRGASQQVDTMEQISVRNANNGFVFENNNIYNGHFEIKR